MKRATVRFKKTCRLALARYVFSKPPLLFIFLLLHTVLPTPPGARAAINNAAGAATGRARRWRRSGRRGGPTIWVNKLTNGLQTWGSTHSHLGTQFVRTCSSSLSMYYAVSAAYFKHESPFALHITNQWNIMIQVSSYWISKKWVVCLFDLGRWPKALKHEGQSTVCCSLFRA